MLIRFNLLHLICYNILLFYLFFLDESPAIFPLTLFTILNFHLYYYCYYYFVWIFNINIVSVFFGPIWTYRWRLRTAFSWILASLWYRALILVQLVPREGSQKGPSWLVSFIYILYFGTYSVDGNIDSGFSPPNGSLPFDAKFAPEEQWLWHMWLSSPRAPMSVPHPDCFLWGDTAIKGWKMSTFCAPKLWRGRGWSHGSKMPWCSWLFLLMSDSRLYTWLEIGIWLRSYLDG